MKLIKKLRLRFTVISLLIGSLFMLAAFGTIFVITYRTTMARIDELLLSTLRQSSVEYPDVSDPIPSQFSVFSFLVDDDGNVSETDPSYLSPYLPHILAYVRADYTVFRTDGMYFRAMSSAEDGDAVRYAVYEYSKERDTLLTLAVTLGCTYLICVAVVGLLAMMFSKKAVLPAELAIRKQEELVANASHELKTPLAIIATDLSLLAETSPASPEFSRWLGDANGQIDRMNALIHDMLELSRAESGVQPPKTNVNLGDALNAALLAFEVACFEKNVSLETSLSSNVTLYTDENSFVKIVNILLDNALKYVNRGGTVTVGLTSRYINLKFCAVLTVRNTGRTIPHEDLEFVFERFYKVERSREDDGTASFGLGLAIARSLTESLGGTISAASERGETTFTVILPQSLKNTPEA